MKKIVLLFCLSFISMGASASENLWRDCGIGHWIAGPTWHGLPAITTNLVWDLGTTATTSHVSTPAICAGPFWASAKFIKESYPQLERDTAQGEGEHLIAMMDILGCDSTVRPSVINGIRGDFSQSVASDKYVSMTNDEKAEQYFNTVVKHSANVCNAA